MYRFPIALKSLELRPASIQAILLQLIVHGRSGCEDAASLLVTGVEVLALSITGLYICGHDGISTHPYDTTQHYIAPHHTTPHLSTPHYTTPDQRKKRKERKVREEGRKEGKENKGRKKKKEGRKEGRKGKERKDGKKERRKEGKK